jgi:hypothetical protein
MADDIVLTRVIGDFTLGDMQAFYVLVAENARGTPIYSIGDMTRSGTIGPEARRYAVAQSPRLGFACSVVFGVSRLTRTLFILLGRAAQLAGRSAGPATTLFVASETEALEYVYALRQRQRRGSAEQ